MRVLSVLAILYSFYTCTCINSDDEDGNNSKEKKYKSKIRAELEEEMSNLRLGARPKTRKPLTNQFPVDYYGLRKEIEDEIGEGGPEKWVEEQARKAREEIERKKSEERENRERRRHRHRHPHESPSHHSGHPSHGGDQQGIRFYYPPYDPNAKHIAPVPIMPTPDPQFLKKPPVAVHAEIYATSGPLEPIYDDVTFPPPPPTLFPRPCNCTGPRHSGHVGEQGAVGGAPEEQDPPTQPIDPSDPQMPELGSFEFHKRFENPGDQNPNAPHGGVQVIPPPPPPRPFQNVRPQLPPNRPGCYEDITEKLNEIPLDTKDKDSAYNSNFRQYYGHNGSLCHEFTPVPRNVFIHVTHRGETIWRATSNRRCNKVQLCNIGFTDKVAILFFTTGDQATYRKRKNKWYRV